MKNLDPGRKLVERHKAELERERGYGGNLHHGNTYTHKWNAKHKNQMIPFM